MDIQDAVNIGHRLGADLRQAGIKTVEDLQKLGYREAWIRLQAVAPDRDCTHSLLALAGAIEGVRWSQLPVEVRKRIKEDALNGNFGNR